MINIEKGQSPVLIQQLLINTQDANPIPEIPNAFKTSDQINPDLCSKISNLITHLTNPHEVDNDPFLRAKYLILKNRQFVCLNEISRMLTKICNSPNLNKVQNAREILNCLHQVNVEPNDYIYRVIIDIYIKANATDVLLDLFKEMHTHNFTATPFTCNKIIDAYAKKKKIDKVVECYNKMKEYDFPIDRINFNTIIAACADCHQHEVALRFKSRMIDEGFQCDKYTWTALMRAAFKTNQFQKGIVYFENIIAPDAKAYNILISECCKMNKTDLAEKYMKEMQERGFKPAISTCQSIIEALYNNGKSLRASPYVKLKLQLQGRL